MVYVGVGMGVVYVGVDMQGGVCRGGDACGVVYVGVVYVGMGMESGVFDYCFIPLFFFSDKADKHGREH